MEQVEIAEAGTITFAAALPSALLLHASERHLVTGRRLRRAVLTQLRNVDGELRVTNESLLYDFFEHAFTGIVLAHASVHSFAIELIPAGYTLTDEDKVRDRYQLERTAGIELLLSRVLPEVTGKPNPRTDAADLWTRVTQLKTTRDDISHVKAEHRHLADATGKTIFARVLTDDLAATSETVRQVMAHFTEE